MTIHFTEKEKRWLDYDLSKPYPFSCKKDAPKEIRESIERKIKLHKEWLEKMYGVKR